MNITRSFTALGIACLASAAWAGEGPPVPGPEAGVSLGAMALVGAGYVALRRWMGRR